MLLILIAMFATIGAALYSVLDRPLARDRRRNRHVSATLLALSGGALAAGLVHALAAWLQH